MCWSDTINVKEKRFVKELKLLFYISNIKSYSKVIPDVFVRPDKTLSLPKPSEFNKHYTSPGRYHELDFCTTLLQDTFSI